MYAKAGGHMKTSSTTHTHMQLKTMHGPRGGAVQSQHALFNNSFKFRNPDTEMLKTAQRS